MTHLHGYTPGFRPYRPQVSSFVGLFCRSLLRVFSGPIARRCPPYIYRSQKRPKKETHKRDLKKKDAVVLATFFPVMGLILWVSFVGLFCGSFPPLSPAGVLPTYIGLSPFDSVCGLICGSLLWVSFVGLFCGSFPPLSPAGVHPRFIGLSRCNSLCGLFCGSLL